MLYKLSELKIYIIIFIIQLHSQLIEFVKTDLSYIKKLIATLDIKVTI